MIYKKIETTAEEIMEFIRNAGIIIEDDSSAKSLQIKLADGNIISLPPDFNIIDEISQFTATCSYSYSINNADIDNGIYVLDDVKQSFDNYVKPSMCMPAA